MAPSSNDGALPVAAPALSSRIAVLFAAHPSPLSLSGGRTARPTPPPVDHRQSQAELADDEALFKGAYLPNGGVGYAPAAAAGDSDDTAATKELRSRMLGKRARDSKADRERWAKKKGAKADDTDEDEDVGRSALGKRKRPRREAHTAEKQGEEDDEREGKGEDGTREGEADRSAAAQVMVEESTQPATTTTTKRKKNKKKKNMTQQT